ncbi:hypothetical protein [Bradyrhizobium sp. STM 3557]|uniref:hypothetical protein n=1 Tax=Bradyrhizobium sp. STM 3557 TaxID=578920 RepID=UPI00388F9BBF
MMLPKPKWDARKFGFLYSQEVLHLLQKPGAIEVRERNPNVGESFLLRTVATNFSATFLCERASWLGQDRRLPREGRLAAQ